MSKASDFVIEDGVLKRYTGPGGDVVIPDGVTSIGYGAFFWCDSLTSVTIPEGVTSIGEKAFERCKRMTSVTIPGSVTSIGEYAFRQCSRLASVTIPEGVTSIGNDAFRGCSRLTSVTIPEGFTNIGVGAFSGCAGLRDAQGLVIVGGVLFECVIRSAVSVTIPEGVTCIGDEAFRGYSSLTSVTIPEGVTSIGNGAFSGCSSLTSVTIPESVTSFGSQAFYGCAGLQDAQGLVIVGGVLFECVIRSVVSVTIPEGVTCIGDGAFRGCSSLTSVTIPEGVTSIGNSAFGYCEHLTSVTIPEGVTSIGRGAFFGCESLKSVTIPESVTSIGSMAFYGCAGLQDAQGRVIVGGVLYYCAKSAVSVTIPEGVTSISEKAFYECSSLTSVTIPEGVTSIGNSAFENCKSLTSVTIPEGITLIGDRTFYWCKSLTSVTIPESVTSIGDQAFEYCVSLTSVTIPEGVTSIGDEAFSWCESLTSVTIPESVTSIGSRVFYECKSLTSVTIPKSVTSIGNSAFYDCYCLTSVTIPEGVTSIGYYAFSGCESLTSVTIPESVTSIDSAFFGCGKLREMTLPLSVALGGKFYPAGNTIVMTLTQPDLEPIRMVAVFRSDSCLSQTWEYKDNRLFPLDENAIQIYDRLVAVGSYDGFQMKEEGRIRAALWRLKDRRLPVSDELQGMFADILRKKVNKAIKIAEADGCASYIRTLVDVGAINEGNLKKIKKVISASSVQEIRALADSLITAVPKSSPESVSESAKSNIEPHLAARLKQLNATAVLLKLGVSSLPEVKMADGSVADADYLRLILVEYLPKNCNGFSQLADEVAEKLDRDSLKAALMKIHEDTANENNRLSLLLSLFRYADGSVVSKLYPSASKLPGKKNIAKKALLLSDTRDAMLLAEKNGFLDEYAAMRGTDAETLRDTVMADFGFDEHGQKRYDLGNKTVIVSVGSDLKTILFDETTGKPLKSLPKKGADTEKYAAVSADLSDLKKNVKKVAKARCDRLFNDFLLKRTYDAGKWQRVYLGNPVMHRVAELVLWSQGTDMFTLGASGPIRSDGSEYVVTDAPICVAHPMEMEADEVTAWQSYFVARGLKQPFEQIWEPVIDPETIRPDRYKGVEVSVFRFMHMEKHGISFYDEDFHNEIGFGLEGCSIGYKRTNWHRHEIAKDETFTLGEFSFDKYTRQVNHIVALLDRWTVAGRVTKDDVSVREYLDQFTAAQIMEFIRLASENNCPNCTAMLLEYKQQRFPDIDPLAEFTLE